MWQRDACIKGTMLSTNYDNVAHVIQCTNKSDETRNTHYSLSRPKSYAVGRRSVVRPLQGGAEGGREATWP